MQEPTKTALDTTYGAVVVLLRLTDNATFPFRIAVTSESDWVERLAASGPSRSRNASSANHHELTRCAADDLHGIFQGIVKIARAPMFKARCQNSADERPTVDPATPRFVIYLSSGAEHRNDTETAEPTPPSVPHAISALRPKAPSARSA